MGIHDSSPRDREKVKQKDQDFYQTPRKAVRILVEHLKEFGFSNKKKGLDPCCGELAITEEFLKYFKNIHAYDLYPQKNNLNHRCRFDFYQEENKYDFIVMNPPYSQKKEFINHALKIAKDVFVFLPLQVMNYIDFSEGFLDSVKFVGKIIIYPKMILNQTQEYKQGGITAYAWFHFSNSNNNLTKYEYYYDMRKFQ